MTIWSSIAGLSDRAIALYEQNHSASSIAAALNGEFASALTVGGRLHPISRNAVLGHLFRKGLTGKKPKAPKVAKLEPRPALAAVPAPAPVPQLAHQPAAAPVERGPRVPMLKLRDGMCRWPLGDPAKADFGFCGEKVLPGAKGPCGGTTPYCTGHTAIAFVPASERRRLRA